MTWLYLPTTCLASALGSGVLTSESTLPSPDRFQSLSWRGKPRQPQLWSRAWKMDRSLRRLSGLTLEPSTADRGAASWIASVRATRANPTALREDAREVPTTDGLSTRFSASSKKCGLVVSSAKTCRGTRTDSSGPSSRHWREWVIALRQEYSRRAKSEPDISGSDSSSWPTAKTATGDYSYSRGDHSKPVLNLEGAAKMWPTATTNPDGRQKGMSPGASIRPNIGMAAKLWATPNVPNGGRVNPAGTSETGIAPDGSKKQIGIETQAKAWPTPTVNMITGPGTEGRQGGANLQTAVAAIWSTPRASDGEKGGPNQSFGAGGVPLPSMAAQWPTPTARDHRSIHASDATMAKNARPLSETVSRFSPQDLPMDAGLSYLGSSQDSRRRFLAFLMSSPACSALPKTLNPNFVEWLMGWPIGWTASAQPVTEFALWLRRMRGQLSTLCLPTRGDLFDGEAA